MSLGTESMSTENEQNIRVDVVSNYGGGVGGCLRKFKLYETFSNFYMIGWNKNRTCWKVLKINRLEQSELVITEDSTTYSKIECYDLLKRIHEGNKSNGGLKFVTTCYGIVGFIKFLEPYYMLLITKRRKIGSICGHAVYSIAKSEMIPISNSSVQSNMASSKDEYRYKKLMRIMDLTKDFAFSYSYHLMLSLQKNLSNHETGPFLYETMFVWNEFLTRGIRNQLKNSVWTVALIYGFFKQVKLSISGRDCHLILIARRSRYYAGTRYLKRGVNEKGSVANDVETEQIVIEDVSEGNPIQISSVVQNRGSIPLFWSQETSRLNFKPDIILSKKDHKYEATKLHFENLVKRYGNPIIIFNLIKTREKKPRESILRAEFANAIEIINKNIEHENHLKFLHWDLNKYSRNKAANVLTYLIKVATNALDLTGLFSCQLLQFPYLSQLPCNSNYNGDCCNNDFCMMTKDDRDLKKKKDSTTGDGIVHRSLVKPLVFQNGVLRTNCIDCLDRTNVAQFVYGFVALGRQLHILGYIDAPNINLDSPLADDMMIAYEAMGDTLARQYGGSAAHNKIFSEIRGQWKATIQSQEIFRTLQRYYSNAYMDAEKQDAINVFLGHFQPQQGEPALWKLDSDQHCHVDGHDSDLVEKNTWLIIKRSLSDGNILWNSNSPIDDTNSIQMESSRKQLPVNIQGCNMCVSKSTPEFSTCESDASFSRYTPSMSRSLLFPDIQSDQCLENDNMYFYERGDSLNCSNFVNVDWISSSGTSCDEEAYERSLLISSPAGLSLGDIKADANPAYGSTPILKGKEQANGFLSSDSASGSNNLIGFSEKFVQWVTNGDILFPCGE